jgi:LacI family transcriptional regulator
VLVVTLGDVAKIASVSVSTASRALSDGPTRPVAPERRERIWEALRQLDYRPNDAAQRFVRRTHNVGLLLDNVSYNFSDPFWSLVFDGVGDAMIRQEYHLRFALTTDDLKRSHRRRLFSRAHVDGLMLAGGLRPSSRCPNEPGGTGPM